MPFTIAVVQQKGGVGKTTIATSLFAHLVSEGVSAGIVDLDGQGNATAWAVGQRAFLSTPQHGGAEAFTLPYGEVARLVSAGSADADTVSKHILPCTKMGGGFVVPGNPYMAVHNFTEFFSHVLPFDVAIVDTPPRLPSSFFRQIVSQSHVVIAPVQPEPHAVQNVSDLFHELAVGAGHLLDNDLVRIVVTMRQKCAMHDAHEKLLREHYGKAVSQVVIARAAAWGEMAAFEQPWKPKSVVAKATAALWKDIERTLTKKRAAA